MSTRSNLSSYASSIHNSRALSPSLPSRNPPAHAPAAALLPTLFPVCPPLSPHQAELSSFERFLPPRGPAVGGVSAIATPSSSSYVDTNPLSEDDCYIPACAQSTQEGDQRPRCCDCKRSRCTKMTGSNGSYAADITSLVSVPTTFVGAGSQRRPTTHESSLKDDSATAMDLIHSFGSRGQAADLELPSVLEILPAQLKPHRQQQQLQGKWGRPGDQRDGRGPLGSNEQSSLNLGLSGRRTPEGGPEVSFFKRDPGSSGDTILLLRHPSHFPDQVASSSLDIVSTACSAVASRLPEENAASTSLRPPNPFSPIVGIRVTGVTDTVTTTTGQTSFTTVAGCGGGGNVVGLLCASPVNDDSYKRSSSILVGVEVLPTPSSRSLSIILPLLAVASAVGLCAQIYEIVSPVATYPPELSFPASPVQNPSAVDDLRQVVYFHKAVTNSSHVVYFSPFHSPCAPFRTAYAVKVVAVILFLCVAIATSAVQLVWYIWLRRKDRQAGGVFRLRLVGAVLATGILSLGCGAGAWSLTLTATNACLQSTLSEAHLVVSILGIVLPAFIVLCGFTVCRCA